MQYLINLNSAKKLLFAALIALLFSINNIFAQVAGMPGNHTEETGEKKSSSGKKFKGKLWVKIKSTDVPAPIRVELDKDEYAGWKKGRMYRNKSSNIYRFDVGPSSSRKSFLFKADGTVIDEDQ